MYNISTIYRFNTPFLDINNEKKGLLGVIKKVEKSINFDEISYKKKSVKEGNYHKVELIFEKKLGKIEFYYISEIKKNLYHLPIFKLNIFLNDSFLLTNDSKKKAVNFLNNIFECFDGLNEKEYLIDVDKKLYYKKGLFSSKQRVSYDFSNIDDIKKDFESKNGMKSLKDFIIRFQNIDYVLTRKNADEYHKLHGILLYFIYLVFIIYQTIDKTDTAIKNIEDRNNRDIYEGNSELMKERLKYIDKLNRETFDRYKNRLELFFKMF